METDKCRSCGEEVDVEYLLVTECQDILCEACLMHHDCDECFPSECESDSDYESPTEEGSDASTTESSETDGHSFSGE